MSAVKDSVLRRACIALALLAATACTTKHVLSGSDLDGLPEVVHVGDSVRATTTTSVTQQLEVVALEDGTLRGVSPQGAEVVIPAVDLAELEYRTPAPGKAVMLGLAVFFGVAATFHGCDPPDYDPFPCSD
jgi:hypothetical protein